MTDVAREKYLKLMTDIEELEDKVEQLQKDGVEGEQLVSVQEQLAEKRNELTRLSDGCGHPHPQN